MGFDASLPPRCVINGLHSLPLSPQLVSPLLQPGPPTSIGAGGAAFLSATYQHFAIASPELKLPRRLFVMQRYLSMDCYMTLLVFLSACSPGPPRPESNRGRTKLWFLKVLQRLRNGEATCLMEAVCKTQIYISHWGARECYYRSTLCNTDDGRQPSTGIRAAAVAACDAVDVANSIAAALAKGKAFDCV